MNVWSNRFKPNRNSFWSPIAVLGIAVAVAAFVNVGKVVAAEGVDAEKLEQVVGKSIEYLKSLAADEGGSLSGQNADITSTPSFIKAFPTFIVFSISEFFIYIPFNQ